MRMKNPPHPGTGLVEDFEALELTMAEAAKALGISRGHLYKLTKGEVGITADMAFRLEKVVGSTADHWVRLQASYDLAQVRNNADHPAHGLRRYTPPKNAAAQPSLL